MKRHARTTRSWLAAALALTMALAAFASPSKRCANGVLCPPACPMEFAPEKVSAQVSSSAGHCQKCSGLTTPTPAARPGKLRNTGGCYLSEVPSGVAVLVSGSEGFQESAAYVALPGALIAAQHDEPSLTYRLFYPPPLTKGSCALPSPRAPPAIS